MEPNFKRKRVKDRENVKLYRKTHFFCEWHLFYENRELPGQEAHHIIKRSQLGDDLANNLICLCRECHANVHAGKIKINSLMKIKELEARNAKR